MKVFGSSGVRGVVGDELVPEYVLDVARAAGVVVEGDRAALARDTRTTGRLFADAAASGLASAGLDVDRLGELPTPGLQAYCEREGVPGVMITASHNPPAYNGVKLVGNDGVELDRDALDVVERRLEEGADTVGWDAAGQARSVEGAGEAYADGVLASVDRATFADADLTVAIDPGHGAGALTSPDIFRDLGCGVVTVNAQPDGRFPGRDPEPVAANLDALQRLVTASDADLGIAHDGDADRAMFVDETGAVIEGDAALAAVNASQRLVDVVEAANADLRLTPIGSTNIITAIHELQASGARVPVAGEGNGGILFPDYRIARDGAYTAVRFLELVAEHAASELVADYDDYHNERRNVGYDGPEERARMLEAIEATARDADADLDTTDGHRLDYGDAWVLARPSGTEPVVRVYAEARERERAASLADEMRDAIAAAR
jgi:phosphomannomutase/phosphoglucomutase